MLGIDDLRKIRARAEKDLRELMDFYIRYDLDPEGGFYGQVTRDLEQVRDADRSLVLNARLLWTFAAAYRILRDEKYLDAARHELDYIEKYFIDREYGGGYWQLHADGTPSDDRKYVYGQAFLIYGGSEFTRACGDPRGTELAKAVYECLEKHCEDKTYGGYFETYDRAWNRLPESFNIPSPELGSKALNTHLHLIESYTNLYRVWEDEKLRGKLEQLLDIMSTKLLDLEHYHYKPYMTDDWGTTRSLFSFGHDIEGAWLLTEAAEVYGDEKIIENSRPISIRIADSCADGLDPKTGGMYAEYVDGHIEDDLNWWVQAEAVVGFLNAYQLTGEMKFIDYMNRVWDFIDGTIADRHGGIFREWLSNGKLPRDNERNRLTINGWKTPYHNGRMYMEIIERMDKMLKDG